MKVRTDVTRAGRRVDRRRIERVRESAVRATLDDLADRRRREAREAADPSASHAVPRSGPESNGS
jgi:hypothetical protein